MARYLWNRCLRILPAFWVVLVGVAFVAAPLSTLSGGTWNPGEAFDYVLRNSALRVMQPNIPGTVDGWSWNGSLWSLFFEFVAYIGAGLLLSPTLVRRYARHAVPLVYVVGAAGVWWAYGPGEVTTSMFLLMAKLGTYFLAGMVFYFFAADVRVDGRIAALALVTLVGCWTLDVIDVVGGLPLAYVLLWLGAVIPPRWAQRHDISYGVYIYAFPIQTLLEWFVPDLSVPVHVLLAIILVTPFAWASWLLVERPMMRLKHLGRKAATGTTRTQRPTPV